MKMLDDTDYQGSSTALSNCSSVEKSFFVTHKRKSLEHTRRVQGVSGVDLVPWLHDELYLDKYNITAASGPKYLL